MYIIARELGIIYFITAVNFNRITCRVLENYSMVFTYITHGFPSFLDSSISECFLKIRN